MVIKDSNWLTPVEGDQRVPYGRHLIKAWVGLRRLNKEQYLFRLGVSLREGDTRDEKMGWLAPVELISCVI